MMKNLRGTDAPVDFRTHAARFCHHSRDWLHTQQWSWDGGDAIIVLTGRWLDGPTYGFVRIGDTVHTVECTCFRDAVEQCGLTY